MTAAERNAREAMRESMRLNGDVQKKKGPRMESQQRVLNLLVGVLLTGLGWWCNNIWASVQSQQNQITQLNVELARNYAPRLELQARFDKIDTALDRIDAQTKGAHK